MIWYFIKTPLIDIISAFTVKYNFLAQDMDYRTEKALWFVLGSYIVLFCFLNIHSSKTAELKQRKWGISKLKNVIFHLLSQPTIRVHKVRFDWFTGFVFQLVWFLSFGFCLFLFYNKNLTDLAVLLTSRKQKKEKICSSYWSVVGFTIYIIIFTNIL